MIITNLPFLLLFASGAAGAFTKEILDDNCLTMPKLQDDKVYLGFIGSCIIGGFAGYAIDGSILTAFMAGFSGFAIIRGLVAKYPAPALAEIPTDKNNSEKNSETIEQMIRRIASEYGIDADLAVRVAKCESGLRPNAILKNSPTSIDRGLYQWNSHWHPEITDTMAYDPEIATRKFCEAVKAGKLSMWSASQKCWDLSIK